MSAWQLQVGSICFFIIEKNRNELPRHGDVCFVVVCWFVVFSIFYKTVIVDNDFAEDFCFAVSILGACDNIVSAL